MRRLLLLLSLAAHAHANSWPEARYSPSSRAQTMGPDDFATHAHNILREKRRATTQVYRCEECLATNSDGSPRYIRVFYLENAFAVVNKAATEAAKAANLGYSCGSCCIDRDGTKARPECFDADNWDEGWVAKVVHEAIDKLGVNVVALTPANFSAESNAVYQGGSTYEQCIVEVELGNVDLCVGTFWETTERRTRVMFTT
mmetsp:Transcript_47617/g.115965  ORF Transcript_47617/g.115965 Transcript_47617/m.115965 type:complete len:201 (+) Transcript_47617:278-880(+)